MSATGKDEKKKASAHTCTAIGCALPAWAHTPSMCRDHWKIVDASRKDVARTVLHLDEADDLTAHHGKLCKEEHCGKPAVSLGKCMRHIRYESRVCVICGSPSCDKSAKRAHDAIAKENAGVEPYRYCADHYSEVYEGKTLKCISKGCKANRGPTSNLCVEHELRDSETESDSEEEPRQCSHCDEPVCPESDAFLQLCKIHWKEWKKTGMVGDKRSRDSKDDTDTAVKPTAAKKTKLESGAAAPVETAKVSAERALQMYIEARAAAQSDSEKEDFAAVMHYLASPDAADDTTARLVKHTDEATAMSLIEKLGPKVEQDLLQLQTICGNALKLSTGLRSSRAMMGALKQAYAATAKK